MLETYLIGGAAFVLGLLFAIDRDELRRDLRTRPILTTLCLVFSFAIWPIAVVWIVYSVFRSGVDEKRQRP